MVTTEEATTAIAPTALAPRGLTALARDLFRGGLAGLLCGVAFFGLGGRLVMRISALLNPGQHGVLTENGNAIGDITLAGTAELVFFGGIFGGLLAGFIWVAVRDWLPASGRGRVIAAGLAAVSLGCFGVLTEENVDFRILSPAWLHFAMFLCLIAAAGSAIALVDARLERVLPAGIAPAALYAVLALPVGGMTLAILVQAALSQGGLLSFSAAALIVLLLATALGWRFRYFGGSAPRWLRGVAVAALVGAAAMSLLHFLIEANEVMALV